MEQNNKLFGAGFLRRLSACKTAEELCSAAAAEGKNLTQQEATSLLEKLQMQSRGLSDTELDAVVGGGNNKSITGGDTYCIIKCLRCGKTKQLTFYSKGNEVQCVPCAIRHTDWELLEWRSM